MLWHNTDVNQIFQREKVFFDMTEVSIPDFESYGDIFKIRNNASLQLFEILIAILGFPLFYKENNSGTICLFLK
jgi:D-lyxose ketol-isomerase